MKEKNSRFVQIHEQVFTSKVLSKGAKLLFGALYGLPEYTEDTRQQELDLGLPPPVVKRVCYEPVELATYLQWGVPTVRKYVKELHIEGWISWHEGKSRGKNRQLVIRLDEAKKPEAVPPTLKKPTNDTLKTPELFAATEPNAASHPNEVPAPSPLAPPSQLSQTVPSEAERQVEEQPVAGRPGHIRVPEHCLRAPLVAEDLAVVEYCVNEPDNLDVQGYNNTLNAYLSHLWQTRQEHAFQRGRTMVQIWLELRHKHNKPCHGDAVYSKKILTAEYYASL